MKIVTCSFSVLLHPAEVEPTDQFFLSMPPHFRLSTNGHLLLTLMGTIRNGSTLIAVLHITDGSYVDDFIHFILIFIEL